MYHGDLANLDESYSILLAWWKWKKYLILPNITFSGQLATKQEPDNE